MSWIYNNRRILRIAVLLLFIVAFIGPWGFDSLNVPAKYPCEPPTIRLYGDFCGYPISGFGMLRWFGSGIFTIFGEWLRGNFAGRGGEFLVILYILIALLPIVGTLSSIVKKKARPWQTADIVLWVLACVPIVHSWFVMAQSRGQIFHVWGYWMYAGIIMGTITFELLTRTSKKDSQPQ